MARPREFDEEAALDAVVRCFWAKGYEGVSVRELASSMGIAGASLYNAFGDKQALYQRALTRYVEQSFQDRVARFEGLPPRQAISAFFNEIIARSLADEQRQGCMLVNSVFECALHDEAAQTPIVEVVRQIEAFFRRCVEAGQADGTITSAETAEDLARLLLGTLMGIRALARLRPERDMLEGVVRPIMSLLGGNGSTSRKHKFGDRIL
jgi:TetR/AcrR family transcriptional regulator, transcriptional repressor for nem operon